MIRVVLDIFRVLNMPCKEHASLMSRQLDEPLPRGEAIGLRLHILYCRACRRFRRQIHLVRDLCTKVGTQLDGWEAMPDSVRERLTSRVEGETPKNG